MPANPLEQLYSTLEIMKPQASPVQLIRLGGEKDGAYLVPDDLQQIKACFSPGVRNRKDFEDSMTEQYGMQCHMCDKSSDEAKFRTPLIAGMQTFKKKWLDINGADDSISLDDWVQELAPNADEDLMLQMDIEGAEYRNILHTSDAVLQRFRVVLVEIHGLGVAKNVQRFEEYLGPFLRKLEAHFICVHAHPNNCCGDFTLNTAAGLIHLPMIHELTFLRRDRFTGDPSDWYEPMMPHPMDISRNVPSKAPIALLENSVAQPKRNQASEIKRLQDELTYYKFKEQRQNDVQPEQALLHVFQLSQQLLKQCIPSKGDQTESKESLPVVDVAAGKPFVLSSTYAKQAHNGVVVANKPYFFHTAVGVMEFICIDLQQAYVLSELIVSNRVDGFRERGRCLFYVLHDQPGPDLSMGRPLAISEDFWQGKTLTCTTPLYLTRARYVTVFSPEKTALHLSEVQVMALI